MRDGVVGSLLETFAAAKAASSGMKMVMPAVESSSAVRFNVLVSAVRVLYSSVEVVAETVRGRVKYLFLVN